LFFAREEFFSNLPWLFILLPYVEDKAQTQIVMVLPLAIRNRHAYNPDGRNFVNDEVLE
jgi:hypothetical protein